MFVSRLLGVLLFALYAVAAISQEPLNFAGFSTCSLNCFVQSLSHTNCSIADKACLCADERYAAAAASCSKSNCTIRENLAATNATWTQCGFDDPDLAPKVRWVIGTVAFLTAVFVFLRIISKVTRATPWGADDTTTIISFALLIASCATIHVLIDLGMGKNTWYSPPNNISEFLKYIYILTLSYVTEVALIKASILFFFLRIFPDKRFCRMLWVAQAVNLIILIVFLVTCSFQCSPVNFFWTGWDGNAHGKCLNLGALALSHVGFNIAFDIIILILPIVQLYHLKMDRKKKIGVIAMFQLGFFVTFVSILRIQTLTKFITLENPTIDASPISYWAGIEVGTGIVIVCMPNCWQLFRVARTKAQSVAASKSWSKSWSWSRSRSQLPSQPNSQQQPWSNPTPAQSAIQSQP